MGTFSFNVDSVLPKLTQVSNVIGNKSTLPVFECVYFTEKEGNLFLKASDGETWIEMRCDGVTIESKIDFCVNAKNFVSTLRNLSGVDVRIDVDEQKNLLYGFYGKKGKFKLPIRNGSEFVNETSIDTSKVVSLSVGQQALANAIQSTDFAVANDELRPIMNGIHFDFSQNGMESAASDGHRLVHYVDESTRIDNEPKGFTLPTKPSRIILPLLSLPDSSSSVNIEFTDEHLKIKSDDWFVQTRLCVGRYPNYKGVIPRNNENHSVVDKSQLLNVLNRVIPFGSVNTKMVKMLFGNNEILISAEDIDWSTSSEESVDCQYDGANGILIGFKGDLLTQVVRNIQCDEIVIDVRDSRTAAVFRPLNDIESTKYVSILMPLML